MLLVGRHPAGEMPAFLRAADGVLVHLRPSAIAEYAIPTKILSYLAASRPILCAAGGASAELVRAADAGLITEPYAYNDIVAVKAIAPDGRAIDVTEPHALHVDLPPVTRSGRRYFHTPEFRRRERCFRHFERADCWVRDNLQLLLRVRRDAAAGAPRSASSGRSERPARRR